MNASVRRIRWDDCDNWQTDDWSVHHRSKRYFSVVFVHADGHEHLMIDQPEVGILGSLVARQSNGYQWLMQSKAEPGNVGINQWAPTVQATRSNYERIHAGKPTAYLEFFTGAHPLLIDVLGSEQGDRFVGKFNRNCKIVLAEVFEPSAESMQFSWMPVGLLKKKLREDFCLNTDARSVIASGAWHLLASDRQEMFLGPLLDMDIAKALHRSATRHCPNRQNAARHLLTRLARQFPDRSRRVKLDQVREFQWLPDGVVDMNNERVLGYFDCRLPAREVPRWQQPLLERTRVDRCVLLFTVRDAMALFRLGAYPEAGFCGRAELGPSLQSGDSVFKVPPQAWPMRMREAEVVLEIRQSDEGGRFYRNIGHYQIARWHGDPDALNPDNGCWLSAADLERFSQQPGLLSNELRTLLSLLLAAA